MERCHDDVMAQRAFNQELTGLFRTHQDKGEGRFSHERCDLCEQFLEAMLENDHILDEFNDRLERARRGLYE